MAIYIYLYIYIAVTLFLPSLTNQLQSTLLLFRLHSNDNERRKQKVQSVSLSPAASPEPPPPEPDHHTVLALPQHLASVCGSRDAKNRCPVRAEPTSRCWHPFGFCCGESSCSGAVVVRGGGVCVPQWSDFRGLKETRQWRVAPWLKRSRALRSRRGGHRSSTAEGSGVVFQPRRGVVSPPRPPPFLTGLIFHFSRSLSSSNFSFFSSRFSWRWLFLHPDTKRRPAAVQWGGFMAPWPRCCFCFCCRRSCSSADGPGCIMELDQMDCRESTASEQTEHGSMLETAFIKELKLEDHSIKSHFQCFSFDPL